jgi:lanthanide-dependent methanol dehydrogenase
MTMAPLVVKGKVLVGNSGGEMGVRGWLTALDADSGKIAWRAYSTGPDKDVLIGEKFRPFYEQDRGKDLGVTTWPPDLWRIGGGTVWGWISYDPELNLIYYGTSNPGRGIPSSGPVTTSGPPASSRATRHRPSGVGVSMESARPLRLRRRQRERAPHVADRRKQRKVLVRPERNGFVYVMDRTTGEVMSADPFVYTNDDAQRRFADRPSRTR